MAKRKSGMFSGRTSRSMELPKSSYGYLKIPEDINVFKPEGNTDVIFDILPYRVTDPAHLDGKKYAEDAVQGELWWKRPLKTHRIQGEDITVVCPTTFGKKCPICEDFNRLRKAKEEWENIKDLQPKDRTIFIICIIDASECDVDYPVGSICIMDQSYHLFTKYLHEETDRHVDYDNFPDPYDGLSLKVYFREKKLGKKNSFIEAGKIDFIEREEQYDEEFLDTLPKLDDIIEVKDYKEIQALYAGMSDMDEDDIDDKELEEDSPRREKKTLARPSTRKAPRRTEDKEEDPTERPLRTRPRKEEESTGEESTRRAPRAQKCPYDHIFGEDFDQYKDCDDCKLWDDCKEKYQTLAN